MLIGKKTEKDIGQYTRDRLRLGKGDSKRYICKFR